MRAWQTSHETKHKITRLKNNMYVLAESSPREVVHELYMCWERRARQTTRRP